MKLSLGKLSLITGLVLAASSQASFASTLGTATAPIDSAYNTATHGVDNFGNDIANIFKHQRKIRKKSMLSAVDHANQQTNHTPNTGQTQEAETIRLNTDNSVQRVKVSSSSHPFLKARTSTQHSPSVGNDIEARDYIYKGPI